MTTTLEWPAPTSVKPRQWPRRLRAHWRRLLAAVIALAFVATGSGWLVYAHTYQPWQPGYEGYTQGHLIAGVTDGLRETALIVTAPTGQTGWFGMTLKLAGSHDVTFLGPAKDWEAYDLRLKWQVASDPLPVSPEAATHSPIVVHPGQRVMVWILATRPKCGQGDGRLYYSVSFRWKALGVHHVSTVPIAVVSQPAPLYVCYPDDALKHLYGG